MALTKDEIEEFRKYLDECVRPLFFFDDDPDGLASFLLLYRYKKEGYGVIVKSTPELNEDFIKKVHEYNPDMIFVLDKSSISQEFLDMVKVPVIWLDHHRPVNKDKVKYYNPRLHDDSDNRPTSYWAYKITEKDQWISVCGCIGDYFIPEFASDFKQEYPDLLPEVYNDPGKILHNTKLGELVKVFSFILKGKVKDALKNVKILTRIKDPYEIINKTTAQGKHVYKKYLQIKKEYEIIFSEAIEGAKKNPDDPLLFYMYEDNKMSFTADLSNELLYRFPKRLIIVARVKNSEYKCSLRSATLDVESILKKSLENINGYGGGHKHACGAVIKEHDFEQFLNNLRVNIKK